MQEVKKLVEAEVTDKPVRSFATVYRAGKNSTIRYWVYGILLTMLVVLLLPWTQNIRARGSVTTLRQEQRPQELNTIIAG